MDRGTTNMTIAAPLYVRSASKAISARKAVEAAAVLQPMPVVPGLFSRMFRRQKPSVFQRCLAIHMYNAAPPTALE
jgi:hypothetical protein